MTAPVRAGFFDARLALLEPPAEGVHTVLSFSLASDLALVESAVELVGGYLLADGHNSRLVRLNARVSLAEALANAIVYGHAERVEARIDVRVGFATEYVEISVRDRGEGFDPDSVPDPTLPENIERVDGRGIFLIRRLADEVSFEHGGSAVLMRFRRSPTRLDRILHNLRLATGEVLFLWRDRSAPLGEAPVPGGTAWFEPLGDEEGTVLQVGPGRSAPGQRGTLARSLAGVVTEAVQGEREASVATQELASRYEEIELLYTISETLGRTVRLEEAASTIVRELAAIVGARRASIMVYDEPSRTLRVVGSRGLEGRDLQPVDVNDQRSVAARVFREQEALIMDCDPDAADPEVTAERRYRGRSFLAVPITVAPLGKDPRPVGVINLTDRIGSDCFTAGHKRLIAAVANQVAATIENARLVESERSRARFQTELAVAHELQLALMPNPAILARTGDIGARSQAAESVGGDFYDIISLRRDAVGVCIGDVSGHNYSAALLMAHVMSAIGILAQSSPSPEETLERLLEVIDDELRRTDMYISLFYGVVDR
ncbi:MAG TPA: ATP-binding protein, partial [Gemmatimonadales bacterium]|nr:ATP-binding protein [Gemmatimonadales bacterium]